jgi:hypothetical protein
VNGFERITLLAPFTHVELRNSGPTEVVLAAHLDAASAGSVWTADACGSLPAHGRQRELTCIGPAIATDLGVPELE